MKKSGRKVKFGLIAYRVRNIGPWSFVCSQTIQDHPPEEKSYVTKIYPFTGSATKAKGNVSDLSAEGGGDRPEAVAAALAAGLTFPFRPTATKMCVHLLLLDTVINPSIA